MSTNAYPQGSKRNPFSWEAFQALVSVSNWPGGWVMQSSKLYRDSTGQEYTSFGGDAMGDYDSCPYPLNVYQQLLHNGMWIGGWVRISEYNDITYIPSPAYSGEEGSNMPGSGSEACGCGSEARGSEEFDIPIEGGSHTTLAITPECIIFVIRFSWSPGIYNTETDYCNSTFSFELLDAKSPGTVEYVSESLGGYAYWQVPMQRFQCHLVYNVARKSNPKEIIRMEMDNAVIYEAEGCI